MDSAPEFTLVRAANPGPLSLSGTNSWLVGHDPAYLVDPGPALASHLDALERAIAERGGLGGIVLTHDHHDHAEGLAPLLARVPAPVGAARGSVDVQLGDGSEFGPFRVLATPGHAPDHLAFLAGGMCFSGDAVLGEGSVFIAPYPGALSGYLRGLERLQAAEPATIHPGHGPLVEDPRAKLAQYLAHRLERERKLIDALGEGLRGTDQLLDRVWGDAPASLRGVAAITLEAHLNKLEEEGRLPEGVQRGDFSWI